MAEQWAVQMDTAGSSASPARQMLPEYGSDDLEDAALVRALEDARRREFQALSRL